MQRKNNFVRHTILTAFLTCLVLTSAQAAKPLWTITPAPGTNPTMTVPENSTVTVQYIVRNQSKRPKRLAMQPMSGISQASICHLAPRDQAGSTCTLTLTITGSALPKQGVHGGPVLCTATSGGKPNPNQCYRPSATNILHINKGSSELGAIAVSPSALDLVADSGMPGFLTITNNSTSVTAQNVQATLPASWADVTQDAGNCAAIAPNGGTCQLQFTPGAATHAAQTIAIFGTNTTEVNAQIAVNAPAQASLAVSGAPLMLAPGCGTGTELTVTNTSTSVSAESLSIDLGALAGDVQTVNDNCTGSTLAANGGQCTFELQGTNAAAAANILVEADNAPVVSAAVEVRQLEIGDIYQQGIVFEVDNCNNGKAAATEDGSDESEDFTIEWGGWNNGSPNCIETTATDDNGGALNTETIYNVLTTNNSIAANTYPAGICYEYAVNAASESPCTGDTAETCYSNWYLPANNELNTLWEQTDHNGGPIAGFNDSYRWSSTEVGECTARDQRFSDGNRESNDKILVGRFRCVRAFTPSAL